MKRLAVIGAGLMGGGIALDAARHGLDVLVFDQRPDGVDKLKARAAHVYGRWVKNGRLSQADADAALARLAPAATLSAIRAADVVIEAVFEDLAVKRALFTELEAHLAPSAILATNTSALKVGDLAQGFSFAPRVLGLHYFSPAEVSPLVEVVRSAATADATVEQALAFLEATRRTPLPCKDRPGFAINRFFCPYYNEATRIVEDGIAGPADVDQVAQERLGAAAGPFTVMNLIRPAVSAHAMTNLASLGPFYTTSRLLDAQAKTGADWPLEDRVAGADLDLVERRLLGALALPALELAAEQVAAPAAVDQGAVLALKFKEGPFALMHRYGAVAVEAAVGALCARDHHPVPAFAPVAAA
ncbi:3-hydroxyacyl-CoA dehydrogenase family protein [Xanthobacter agilis]|uniref:3-hydroxybutyryl-CoA dehydrogenase n=1 Tax=Xanthobacter agilis TaxID=47492 RepID=A0ABU0LFJ8_XANAG|nr:3-hydroxyacyl-CoA dehydrogenase family protein [Xanthobacter agilis]MDQ0505916.1 3-hydroxybutyryl-CoA dehydrogenase [Xanthobacter agilis]